MIVNALTIERGAEVISRAGEMKTATEKIINKVGVCYLYSLPLYKAFPLFTELLPLPMKHG